MDLTETMIQGFRLVRKERPLVHMISSAVTGALCADAIAAVGGRPVMAQAKEEMEEITASADGLAVNLGQPSNEKYLACRRAMETAASCGLPVILDPVGAGASEYRRAAASGLFTIPWSGIIKGNSSEIHTVLTGAMAHSGVDSIGTFSHREEAEQFLHMMRENGRELVIAETGIVDKILWLDEKCGKVREILLKHSSERPVVLVGTGCMTGAVLGALLAAEHKRSATAAQECQSGHARQPIRAGQIGDQAGQPIQVGQEYQAGQKSQPGQPIQARPSVRADKLAVLAAAAVSMVSFCGEEMTGTCGYGTYKTRLLDALSMPEEEAYGGYLKKLCQIM